MNIAVLTNNKSFYGKKLIQQLEITGISLVGIIIVNQPLSYHIRLFKYVKKRVGLVQAIFLSISAIIRDFFVRSEKINYSDFISKIYYADGNKSVELEQILKQLEVDVLVLGQTGIIRENIINTAKKGVLNAHPGVLPYYRGIDCLRWALFNNELSRIGCSVHWVDAGVDTGNIISTRHYKLNPNLSLDELDRDLYLLCIQELVEVIHKLENGNILNEVIQKKIDGKQYYKMPLSKVIKTNKILEKLNHENA